MSKEKDRELRLRIQAMLDSHKEFKGYGLEASVHEGKVQLSGVVDTLADSNRAVEMISQMEGVQAVENGLAISTDGAITGAGVAMEVAEELKAHTGVNLKNVGPEVAGGKVYLRGNVDSPEEEEAAIEAASRARGVTGVVSRLKIRPAGYDTGDPGAIFHHQVNNDREDERENNAPAVPP